VGGITENSSYHSDRIRLPAPPGQVPPGFHNPCQPFVADLGEGVMARVPLAMFADPDGTLPHDPLDGVGAPGSGAVDDLPTRRLAGVVIAWNVFQHFYPYWDVVKADWPQALQTALGETLVAEESTAYLEALEHLTGQLQDGHATLYDSRSNFPYVWPPIRLAWIESQAVVVAVGAAAASDLSPGDVVVAVDGQPISAALPRAEALVSAATPQYRRIRALQRLLAGPSQSTISLEVTSGDGTTRTVSLKRTVKNPDSIREPRPDSTAEPEPGLWYLDLERTSHKIFSSLLDQLVDARGIIFDLRGYPAVSSGWLAHLIDQPVSSAQFYMPQITTPDFQDMTFEEVGWSIEPTAPRLRTRIVFLTDGRAISRAETQLGIVAHYRLAEIVGEPTAGTSGDINAFSIPSGYRIYWTGLKVLKHDGSQHHGVGILPTLPVSRTLHGVRDGRDEQLERAVEVIRQGG
jgi:C-terminal processing protease CtpA/Prc